MRKVNKVYCLILIMTFVALLTKAEVHAVSQTELLQYLENAAQGGPIYEVIQNGSGDFSSIREAVEQVESGATLLIYPGIYDENVEIMGKTVNLIGASKDGCILISDTINYHHIPLTIGAGIVYNMTICGSNPAMENIVPYVETNFNTEDSTSIYNWQNNFPGYAIHIDQYYSHGKELLVENCRIISDSNQCVGIGCRGGSTITFANCQFLSNGSGCLYLHNTQDMAGNEESHFIMRDCELKNYGCPYVMSFYSTGDLNPTYLTFQNVKVSTMAYESKNFYKNDNMNTWYSVDQLQKPEVMQRLYAEGYHTSASGALVHNCDIEEYMGLQVKRGRAALLGSWPNFSEGIHYFCTSDDDKMLLSILDGAAEKRQVIEIRNTSPYESRDGWCGLHNIFLTEESYGNTLIEMNYPRMIMMAENAE